jgi:ABC-type molybdate transport system substrate-binding protein
MQVESGAPIDMFASASQNDMNLLSEKNLIENSSRKDFAANTLVMVVPEKTASKTYCLRRPDSRQRSKNRNRKPGKRTRGKVAKQTGGSRPMGENWGQSHLCRKCETGTYVCRDRRS